MITWLNVRSKVDCNAKINTIVRSDVSDEAQQSFLDALLHWQAYSEKASYPKDNIRFARTNNRICDIKIEYCVDSFN